MGDRPECCEFRGLWVVFLVAPEASIPMRAGTGEQGVFEHVDSRAELLPEDGSPQGIHRYASKCNNDRQIDTPADSRASLPIWDELMKIVDNGSGMGTSLRHSESA
jgi:hypothetical protein